MSERKPNGSGPEAETDAAENAAEGPSGGAPEGAGTQDPEAEAAAGEEAGIVIEEEDEIPQVAADNPVARLEAEVSSLKDQLLRAMAEVENVRRRTARERDDAVRYAAGPFIKDLLGVADNLARALENMPEDPEGGEGPLGQLVAGLKLTEKELESAFERHHIVKIDPLGERLDPHRHEAMFEIPDPTRPAGTIAQVVQSGYLLHDRLLRPARVGVAKGGPAASAQAAPAGAPAEAGSQPEAQEAESGEPASKATPGSHVDTEA